MVLGEEVPGGGGEVEAPDEFTRFFDRVFDPLVGAVWLYCGDRGVAEEMAQEALARVARDWARVAVMDAPVGWTHRVAFNLVNSHFRRLRTGRRILERHQDEQPRGDEDAPVAADALVVRQAVTALPRRQREAVVLFYFADLPVTEVARWMGAPENTVKSWLARGRARLEADLRVALAEEDADVC
jgi:RNA polymerase sigma-70 factor, ECF subfamily